MGKRRHLSIAAVAAVTAAIPALAAPPANDDRGNARALTVPSTVNGTTRESTPQQNDPGPDCRFAENSVWYSVDPADGQRVAAELSAKGDLDAVIAVYRRERSQLSERDCDVTNTRGDASVAFRAEEGATYLIMVGQQVGSEAGDFTLELFVPEPEARPPGRNLPRRGGRASVDRARDLEDPWSRRLTAGVSYVVTLASHSDACPTVSVYEPGIDSFDEVSVRTAACNRHRLFTPDRNGRHSFLVRAGRRARGAQRYTLRVRPARRDDTAPGRTIRNYERVRGFVGPGAGDVVDLYRFHVNHRSNATLRFSTGAGLRLELRNVRGRFIDSAEGADLRTDLRRGRYYAVVRSTGSGGGRYTLRPAIREITDTRININGRHDSAISPGQAANVNVAVTPRASGRITIVVERLDPLEGWQFHKRFVRRTSTGHASATFIPRRPGRFRARALYAGSRLSAPSEEWFAYISARERF